MKKVCSKCGVEKDLSAFRRDKTKKDGRQPSCAVCMRLTIVDRYPERYRIKTQARNQAARAAFTKQLNAYKMGRSCMRCAESDIVCLEFHHIDPSAKEFTIAHRRNMKWEDVLIEIEKCVILCSNCHQKYHAGRFNIPLD